MYIGDATVRVLDVDWCDEHQDEFLRNLQPDVIIAAGVSVRERERERERGGGRGGGGGIKFTFDCAHALYFQNGNSDCC